MFLVISGFLSAQTADEMDRLLNTEEVTYSQAAQFVMRAADVWTPGSLPAFTAAKERGWVSGRAEADSPVRLGEVAQLIVKAFGIKGGIMYSLFPVPHYACRTLIYAKIIRGRTDPDGRLDGRAFLQILGRVLNYVGDNEVPVEEP
jgi:hypothetical protein